MSAWLVALQTGPLSTPGPDLMPSLWRMAAGFLVVLALLSALAWAMRRTLNARRKNGPLSVETALSLGERRSIVIVTVESRRLLLGLAPGHVSMLAELQAPSFGAAMARATEQEAPR